MNEFSKVNEEFDQAVELRKELNSVHWKDYNRLATVFAALFGESKGTLKLVSDMNYYKGGYPSQNSPARIDSLFSKVGTVLKYFFLIGRMDEINGILAPFGFEVKMRPDTFLVHTDQDRLNDKKVVKSTDRVMERFGFSYNSDPAEMAKWFLEQTEVLQGVICQMADEIKIDLFETVEQKLEGQIDKAGFTTAVNTVAKKRIKEESQKDTNPLIEKALEKSETLTHNGEFLREKVVDGLK